LKSNGILEGSEGLPLSLPNKSKTEICLIGGTGFVGKWLVAGLLHFKEKESQDILLHIVTRDVQKSKRIFPETYLEHINWIEHDFQRGLIKNLPMVDYYVYGPTTSVVDNSQESQESILNVTLNGAKSIRESIKKFEGLPRVVNLSSGAVYRKARSEDSHHFETDPISIDSENFYTRAKVESESLFQSMCESNKISLINLRLFSFFGEFLPLDKHFAIGNFMQDAVLQREIKINGNSRTRRSYLYGADLATALVRSIFSDYQGALNIGGKNVLTMIQLAGYINSVFGVKGVELAGEDFEANYYYPSVSLSEEILGIYENTPLEMGLEKWRTWILRHN
jgi:nucleoside-diphosphate-sugar epimerase